MIENIIFKNKKIGEAISYLEEKSYREKDLYEAKKDFVDFLTKKISAVSKDYGGFQTKERLKNSIVNGVFGFQKSKNADENHYNQFPIKKIILAIKKSLQNAYYVLPSNKSVKIFILPTLQMFVKNKMSGSSGYTPSGDSIHIYLSIKPASYSKMIAAVKNTVVHEYNHTVRFQYFPNSSSMTLLESLIFEGLAENFTKEVAGKKLSPWASSLNEKDAREIFNKIKPILNSASRKIYYSVFFENKKFPLWAGYSIGYWMIRNFRKTNRNVNWPEIIRMSYMGIFKSSGWK